MKTSDLTQLKSQLDAIRTMQNDDRPISDILIQLKSVRALLDKFTAELLLEHMDNLLRIGSDEHRRQLHELVREVVKI